VPPIYTFHSFNADGAPVAMQATELASERTAAAHAEHVLAEHLSAAYVVVCEEDRELLTRRREEPA
jgi:hypothetical protein